MMKKKCDISIRITTLCARCRIEGAILKVATCLIPEDVGKSKDLKRVCKKEQTK